MIGATLPSTPLIAGSSDERNIAPDIGGTSRYPIGSAYLHGAARCASTE